MFQATELSFTYPSGRRGLGSVSLEATPGDRVVVMGPNGSGKSTLLRLVSTELPSRPGSLTLFGETSGATRSVRKRIGIVQDTPVHVDDLTGMENGLLFAELYGLTRGRAATVFEALCTSLELDEALDVPAREYSYGMKRKPALGLDPPSRAALLQLLEECSAKGVCTLAATNEPALAQEMATTVVLLHEGDVVAHGSPAELMAKVGGDTRIEVDVTGPRPDPTIKAPSPAAPAPTLDPDPLLTGLPEDVVSIQRLPGRIVAESKSGPYVLPQLVSAILGEGLKIERIELREPDLTDVFTHFTGRALAAEKT